MASYSNAEHYPKMKETLYKILLVDDEEVVRHGLKYILDWKSLGFRIANDAGSADEALQFLENNHYDVMMTDIQMPKKSGLELIGEIHEKVPDLKIVIISGYDSFEYAVTGMRYGVEDYLLKPFSREQIAEIFLKLHAELDSERMQRSQQQASEHMAVSHFMYHLLQNDYISNGTISEIAHYLNVTFPDSMILVNFCFENYSEYLKTHPESNNWKMFHRLYQFFGDRTQTEFDLLSCQIGNNCIMVLPEIEEQQARELMRNLAETFGGVCRIGISEVVHNIRELSVAYYQTIEILQYAQSDVSFYNSEKCIEQTMNSRLLAYQNRIIHMLECSCREKIPELTQQVFTLLSHQSVNYTYNWCLNSIYEIYEYFDIENEKTGKISYQLFINTTQCVDLIKTLKTFYEEKLKEIIRILQRLANDPNRRLIEKACQMIEQNYSDSNLSLTMIAEHLNISYGYLCTIFKQITNENFMDYLLRIRMQNAKRLLVEGNRKIWEVAQDVGYNSSRYFTLTFRKYFEMTPSEYIKKFGGKK